MLAVWPTVCPAHVVKALCIPFGTDHPLPQQPGLLRGAYPVFGQFLVFLNCTPDKGKKHWELESDLGVCTLRLLKG